MRDPKSESFYFESVLPADKKSFKVPRAVFEHH